MERKRVPTLVAAIIVRPLYCFSANMLPAQRAFKRSSAYTSPLLLIVTCEDAQKERKRNSMFVITGRRPAWAGSDAVNSD